MDVVQSSFVEIITIRWYTDIPLFFTGIVVWLDSDLKSYDKEYFIDGYEISSEKHFEKLFERATLKKTRLDVI